MLSKKQLEFVHGASAVAAAGNAISACVFANLHQVVPEFAPVSWILAGVCVVGLLGSITVGHMCKQALRQPT